MTQVSTPTSSEAPHAVAAPSGLGSLLNSTVESSKPGIVKMVLVTTIVGFSLVALGSTWDPWTLVWLALACLVGTALSAAGANALNMAMESRRDAAMHRTEARPIPSGRLSVAHGWIIGSVLSVLGVTVLWLGTNPVAALVSLVTILSYVLVYTPLKPVTPLATIVGAFPGALPPLIGWCAASTGPLASIDQAGGWALVAIMFVWQVPHFLALAWKYREDYERGGYRVLPSIDPEGSRTAWTALIWSVALVPLSLLPILVMPGRLGLIYLIVALAGGLYLLWVSVRLVRERSDSSAMRLFLGSIMYLPLVLFAMVGDAALIGLG